MNARRSSKLLAGHRRIGLDSNVIIYLLETSGPLADRAAWLIDHAIGAGSELVLATAGMSEILAGPARSGDGAAFELTADAVRDIRIRLWPLDSQVAEEAAWIRGSTNLDLIDAIYLATSRVSGATLFVTNDRGIHSLPRLAVAYLDDLAIP